MYRSDKDIINQRQFLCEDELFYKNLIKILPDAIFLEKNEKFIFANDEAIKLLGGIDKEDILGKSVMEFLDEKFQQTQEELYGDMVENHEEVTKEKRIVKLNGEVIDVEVKSIYFSPKENCKDKIKVVIVRDITKRKKYEKALKESESLHRKLTELLPMAVCIYDYEKIEFANKKCADILGVKDKDELINKSAFDFICKDNIESSKVQLKKIEDHAEKILPPFHNRAICINGNVIDIET